MEKCLAALQKSSLGQSRARACEPYQAPSLVFCKSAAGNGEAQDLYRLLDAAIAGKVGARHGVIYSKANGAPGEPVAPTIGNGAKT